MRRYFETLFRHKEVFLIPVLLVPALALLVTLYTGREYRLDATIWVDPGSLLDPLSSSSTRSTPSSVEAAALDEWLSTDAFRREVVNRSGLTAVIEAGQWPVPSRLGMQVANVPVVRSLARAMGVVMPVSQEEAMDLAMDLVGTSLSVSADGNNLLRMTYRGKEPELGKRFVEEALTHYNEKTTALRVSQTTQGVDFYTRQVDLQKSRLDRAAAEERQFLEAYPEPLPGQTRPASELAEVERLRQVHALERTLYEAALTKLEEVRIAGEAVLSSRAESFALVDAPEVPESAGVTGNAIMMNVIMGLTVGVVLGLVPIVALTWSDSTVRTRADVEETLPVPLLAQVPLVSAGGKGSGGWIRSAVSRILSPGEGAGRRLPGGPMA